MSTRLGPFKIGNARAWFTSTCVAGQAQVILTIEGHGAHVIECISAAELRAFGNDCKLTACEAEAHARRAGRTVSHLKKASMK